MSLTELLLQAKAKQAAEFIFVVGSEPRARFASGWNSLRSSPALLTEWKILQQSLLSNQQQALLETTGTVQGETSFNNNRIGFSFYQQDRTMKAVLDLDLDAGAQDIALPPSLLESCQRMKGLVLLSGPGEAGQVWALHRILQKISEEKSFVAAIFSPKSFPQMKEDKACYLYHNGEFSSQEEQETLMAGVDVVVFNGYADDQIFNRALALAERGYFVIYSMKAPSLTNALRRCLSVFSDAGTRFGDSRFAEVLTVAAAQYPVPGIQGEKVFAHEVLLPRPDVRQRLAAGQVDELEVLLTSAAENTGILSLNQSLLQHLIRRRLDLKTAFEVSRHPDHLDQLLKKVGI